MKKLQRSNGLIKGSSNKYYLFKMGFVFIWITCTGCSFVQNTTTQTEEESNSYIETFLGDQRTPLVLLKREILSSDDILSCPLNIDIQSIIEQRSEQTFDMIPHQQASMNHTEGLLLGIPLTALNKLISMTGVVTHFSDQGNTVYQAPVYQNIFRGYHLANTAKNVQANLIRLNNGNCFLGFAICSYQDNCVTDDEGQPKYYTKFPVLGISQNHQVIIIDPASIGSQFEEKIMEFKSRYVQDDIVFKVKDPRSFIVGFSKSILVFDIISTLDFPGPSPLPEMTSRWFIRFDLDENKDNFVTKTPIKGVEYLTIHSFLQDAHLILLRNISRDNPAHFYVKNVPDEYQEPFRESFEYWNTIFISLKGYPAFTYKFIQGNYDGPEEIITGDIRYNVLEWDLKYRYRYNGYSINFSDVNTGEILSTSILIQGPKLIEEYSRWFQYSEIIRSNEVIRGPPLTAPFYESTYYLISQVSIDGFPPHHQPLMLAPENETFDSYMPKFLKTTNSHELGHSLGLGHEFKSSTFAQDGYAGHSAMDYVDVYNANKPVSGYSDEMALAYGYLDRLPEKTDISCSDNDLINHYYNDDRRDKSPECSRTDGTNFPLEDFALRLKQTLNLLISRKEDQSFPYLIWNNRVAEYISKLTFGLISYYFSSDTSL